MQMLDASGRGLGPHYVLVLCDLLYIYKQNYSD